MQYVLCFLLFLALWFVTMGATFLVVKISGDDCSDYALAWILACLLVAVLTVLMLFQNGYIKL